MSAITWNLTLQTTLPFSHTLFHHSITATMKKAVYIITMHLLREQKLFQGQKGPFTQKHKLVYTLKMCFAIVQSPWLQLQSNASNGTERHSLYIWRNSTWIINRQLIHTRCYCKLLPWELLFFLCTCAEGWNNMMYLHTDIVKVFLILRMPKHQNDLAE